MPPRQKPPKLKVPKKGPPTKSSLGPKLTVGNSEMTVHKYETTVGKSRDDGKKIRDGSR